MLNLFAGEANVCESLPLFRSKRRTGERDCLLDCLWKQQSKEKRLLSVRCCWYALLPRPELATFFYSRLCVIIFGRLFT